MKSWSSSWNKCDEIYFIFCIYNEQYSISKIIKIFLCFCLLLVSRNHQSYWLCYFLRNYFTGLSTRRRRLLDRSLFRYHDFGWVHTFLQQFQGKFIEKLITNLAWAFYRGRNSLFILFMFLLDYFLKNNLFFSPWLFFLNKNLFRKGFRLYFVIFLNFLLFLLCKNNLTRFFSIQPNILKLPSSKDNFKNKIDSVPLGNFCFIWLIILYLICYLLWLNRLGYNRNRLRLSLLPLKAVQHILQHLWECTRFLSFLRFLRSVVSEQRLLSWSTWIFFIYTVSCIQLIVKTILPAHSSHYVIHWQLRTVNFFKVQWDRMNYSWLLLR